jgi:hypothetical protein
MERFKAMATLILMAIIFSVNMGCNGSSGSSTQDSSSNVTQEQIEMLQAWTDLYFKYGKDDQTSPTLYRKLETDDTQHTFVANDSGAESTVDTASKIASSVCTFAGFPELTPVISLATDVVDLFLPKNKNNQEEFDNQIETTLKSIQSQLTTIQSEISSLTSTVTTLNNTIINILINGAILQNAKLMSALNTDVNNAMEQVKNNNYYIENTHTVQDPGGFYENVAGLTPGLITIIEDISGISTIIDKSQIDTISQDPMNSKTYSTITTDGISTLSYMYLILNYAYTTQLPASFTSSLSNSENTINNINTYDQGIIQQVLFNLQMLEKLYYLGVIAIMERALALEQCPNPDSNSSCPSNLADMAQWSPPFAGFNSEDTAKEQLEAFTQYWVASVKVFLTMIGTDFFVSDINVEDINCQTYNTRLTQIFPTAVETVKLVSLPEGAWTDQCILYRNQILTNVYSGSWDGNTIIAQCAPLTQISNGTPPCQEFDAPLVEMSVEYSTICKPDSPLNAQYRPILNGFTDEATAYGYCSSVNMNYYNDSSNYTNLTSAEYSGIAPSTTCDTGSCGSCQWTFNYNSNYMLVPGTANNFPSTCNNSGSSFGIWASDKMLNDGAHGSNCSDAMHTCTGGPYQFVVGANTNGSSTYTSSGAFVFEGVINTLKYDGTEKDAYASNSINFACYSGDDLCAFNNDTPSVLCYGLDEIQLENSNGWTATFSVTPNGCWSYADTNSMTYPLQ